MSIFNLFRNNAKDYSEEEQLYNQLTAETYSQYPYRTENLGEEMALVNEVIMQYWKPRFLLNNNTKCA